MTYSVCSSSKGEVDTTCWFSKVSADRSSRLRKDSIVSKRTPNEPSHFVAYASFAWLNISYIPFILITADNSRNPNRNQP